MTKTFRVGEAVILRTVEPMTVGDGRVFKSRYGVISAFDDSFGRWRAIVTSPGYPAHYAEMTDIAKLHRLRCGFCDEGFVESTEMREYHRDRCDPSGWIDEGEID